MTEPVNFYEAPATAADDRECPACGETIELKARICPYCQADIVAIGGNIRSKVPRGVRALAYLCFFCVFLFGISFLSLLSIQPKSAKFPVAIWIPVVSIGIVTTLFLSLGISYLKGYRWSWWYTIAVSTLASIIYPIVTVVALIQNRAERSQILPLVFMSFVAVVILYSFRKQDVKDFFLVKDAGVLKTIIAIVVVFVCQFVFFAGPILLAIALLGPGGLRQ
jgi:hypothetical protein